MISLQAFRGALGPRASWRDASRCVVADSPQRIGVAKPVWAPSAWDRLFGGTRLHTAMFGSVRYRDTRRQAQLATLHAFKAALGEEYGPVIAQAACKALRSREVLQLDQARTALGRADALASQILAANEDRLRRVIDQAGAAQSAAASFSTAATSWPRETIESALRACLGQSLHRAPVSESTMQGAAQLLTDLARTGTTQEEVIALLQPEDGLLGNSVRKQLEAARQSRVWQVQSAELADYLKEAGQHQTVRFAHGDSKRGPGASAQPDVSTPRELALARAALDPSAGLEATPRQLDEAAGRANAMHAALASTPRMSECRAKLILDFAASAPLSRRQAVVEQLCRGSLSTLTDVRGVVIGSKAGEQLAPAFRTPRVPELAERMHGNVAGARMHRVGMGDGTEVVLSEVCLKDTRRRTPYVLDGEVLPSAADAGDAGFARSFRGHFPPGERGGELARVASACLNQNNVNTLVSHAPGISAIRKDQDVLHEADSQPDGSWLLRSTCRMLIQAAVNAMGQPVLLPTPVAALYTIESRLRPGAAPGEPPRTELSRLEVAFA